MAALAGAAAGGAVGGVTGALIGMGIPEDQAERYEGRVTKGGILLSRFTRTTQSGQNARRIF